MSQDLSGSVPWEWLASCRACDEPHEYRPARCECGKQRCNEPWTWAADDGHPYQPRMRGVEQLYAEYLTEQVKKSP